MASAVGPGDAALDRAGDETLALRVHLGLDLLAHRPAQDVRLRKGIAGEIPGDLLHLLLIGDDAEGLLEDRLQDRMGVLDLLLSKLAGAIGRDVGHRAGAIERNQRDQVLEPVGPHLDEGLAHSPAFHLEHADRLASSEHREGLRVVERDRAEIDR